MDAAASETQAVARETCDGAALCDGPSPPLTDDISTRDKVIIGSVLGGTAAAVAACLVVLRWRRRRGARRRDEKRREKGKDKAGGDGCGRGAPSAFVRSRGDDDEITIAPERSISWGDSRGPRG